MSSDNYLPNLLLPGYTVLKWGRLHPANLMEKSFIQNIPVLILYGLPLAGSLFISWHQMIYYSNTWDAFAENLFGAGGFAQGAAKISIYVIFKDDLLDLLNDSNGLWDLSVVSDENLKSSIYSNYFNCSKIIKVFQGVSLITALATMSYPYLVENALPAGIYRYEGSHSLYLLCCLTQQLTLLTTPLYIAPLDVIYIAACTMLATQYKIASNFLKEIRHEKGKHCIEDVKKFVDHHNRIFRMVAKVRKIYSVVFLVQYLTGISILCAEMFLIAEGSRLNRIPYKMAVYSYVLFQCWMYCVWADQLSTASASVADTIYESNWQDGFSPHLRKSLVLIINRSQRPAVLSAYGLIDINMETFTKILSASWSYFSILRAMKSN